MHVGMVSLKHAPPPRTIQKPGCPGNEVILQHNDASVPVAGDAAVLGCVRSVGGDV